MLVLSRRVHETIYIGDNVVLTVVRIGGDVVRLGITADPSVRILRGELCDSEKSQDGRVIESATPG